MSIVGREKRGPFANAVVLCLSDISVLDSSQYKLFLLTQILVYIELSLASALPSMIDLQSFLSNLLKATKRPSKR